MKTLILGLCLVGCSGPGPARTGRVLTYGLELEECTRTAETCEASIKCENDVRTRYSRPLRDASKGCQ